MAVSPFIDRPVADPVGAGIAAEEAAAAWGLPAPELLRCSMNAVFASGDVVLRVGHPTGPPESALALHRVLADAGIRVPHPVIRDVFDLDGWAVTGWERIHDTGDPVDWAAMGEMVRTVHSLLPTDLPAGYPLADPRGFSWWDASAMLADLADVIDPAARRGLIGAVARNEGWRELAGHDRVVCHGDVHPGNVLVAADGPVLLDWDLLSSAPRGWDHGPLLTWNRRWGGDDIYPAFAEGYGWSAIGDEFAESVAELRLVAATLMRVRAAQTDPDAVAEAERRLRHWRGDPDAPAWTAQ